MGRKQLTLVPSSVLVPSVAELGRFHSDATDVPILSVMVWTSQSNTHATRTRQLALDKEKRHLLELQRLQPLEGLRSWFVGNSVLQDGGMLVFSRIDALFVLLDAAWPQRMRFSTVYDLLAIANNTWLLQLTSLQQSNIQHICDVEAVASDDRVENLTVKVSQNKVMAWLKPKVERAAKVLLRQDQDHLAASSELVNVRELKNAEIPVARYYRQAIDVVGNYLPDEWIDLLCHAFNVDKVEVNDGAGTVDSLKRYDRRQTDEHVAKRPPSANAGSAKKKSKLANVDRSGMKSLTSFFGKK
ncbi:hypothetical protein PsorP6_013977 [Peronosclerospora sorghi]|uniref:Uncharacterized protein n=1 Tax=Peronosclerospora sorghi TaxID=230839 RepID=A0ACC0VIS4_9STRA|nr:hypothetical protein PsorP6_013977 [Peronosclerospora sorghi]